MVAVLLCVVAAQTPASWMNKADPPAQRARALLAQMTLEEKIVLLHGPTDPMPCCECDEKLGPLCNYTGNVYPNVRLGIPQIKMNDGPQGFRDGANPGTSTAWPSAMTVVRCGYVCVCVVGRTRRFAFDSRCIGMHLTLLAHERVRLVGLNHRVPHGTTTWYINGVWRWVKSFLARVPMSSSARG